MNAKLTKQIECACKVCGANAKFLGLALPLKAVTLESMPKNSDHGLIHIAYHPVLSKVQTAIVKAVA
jgi:hypothetical protein